LVYLEPGRESQFDQYLNFIKKTRILELNIISLLPMDEYVLRTLLKINNNKNFRFSKDVESYLHQRLGEMAQKLIKSVSTNSIKGVKPPMVKGNKVPVMVEKKKASEEKKKEKEEKKKTHDKVQALRLEREAKLLQNVKEKERREKEKEEREKERFEMEKKRMAVFEYKTEAMIKSVQEKLEEQARNVIPSREIRDEEGVYIQSEHWEEQPKEKETPDEYGKRQLKNHRFEEKRLSALQKKWSPNYSQGEVAGRPCKRQRDGNQKRRKEDKRKAREHKPGFNQEEKRKLEEARAQEEEKRRISDLKKQEAKRGLAQLGLVFA
jgi:hypothetical protein